MCLLKLNFSTGFFELLLECFGFVLRNSFLYRTWSSVNDFLRLFQPETGEFLHSLNYCEFRSTCSGEDYKALTKPEMVLPPDCNAPKTFLAGDCNNVTISPKSSSFDLIEVNASSWFAPT